jgi:hypothetical protein
LRSGPNRPPNDEAGNAEFAEKDLLRDWLVIGPFTVEDSVRNFDKDLLGGEAEAKPTAADKSAGLERFKPAVNDHFEAHFGIVGFTVPTPVSDGKYVYVWVGMGIAACFDNANATRPTRSLLR